MNIRLAVYNMEWMMKLFDDNGNPKVDVKHAERSKYLATVVKHIDPDILCIVEGPDTLKDGKKTATAQLEAWCDIHNLKGYAGVHGFVSRGQQELCALYKKSKIICKHAPSKKDRFDEEFLVDTTDDLIKEQYMHYRPPFEISVTSAKDDKKELMRIIVAHTKSKGIFDSVDLARFEQLSNRNRRKLYAECYSIRKRCDQWLDENPQLKLAVVGDINDGFGLDYYEQQLSRSAAEILLGNVWAPKKILQSVLPKPKLDDKGWDPWSSKFRDSFTKNEVRVLIDHVLVSQSVKFQNANLWNPHDEKLPLNKGVENALKHGSDHFPISVDIEL